MRPPDAREGPGVGGLPVRGIAQAELSLRIPAPRVEAAALPEYKGEMHPRRNTLRAFRQFHRDGDWRIGGMLTSELTVVIAAPRPDRSIGRHHQRMRGTGRDGPGLRLQKHDVRRGRRLERAVTQLARSVAAPPVARPSRVSASMQPLPIASSLTGGSAVTVPGPEFSRCVGRPSAPSPLIPHVCTTPVPSIAPQKEFSRDDETRIDHLRQRLRLDQRSDRAPSGGDRRTRAPFQHYFATDIPKLMPCPAAIDTIASRVPISTGRPEGTSVLQYSGVPDGILPLPSPPRPSTFPPTRSASV